VTGRVRVTWATIAPELAAVAATDPPPWVTPEEAQAVRDAAEALRGAVERVQADKSWRGAYETLDIGAGTWQRWTDGWLGPKGG